MNKEFVSDKILTMNSRLPGLIKRKKWDLIDSITMIPQSEWSGPYAEAYEQIRKSIVSQKDSGRAVKIPATVCELIFIECHQEKSPEEKARRMEYILEKMS